MELGNIVQLETDFDGKNFKKGVIAIVNSIDNIRGYGFVIPESGETIYETGWHKFPVLGNVTGFKVNSSTESYKFFDTPTNELKYTYFDDIMEQDIVKVLKTGFRGILHRRINSSTAEVMFDWQSIPLIFSMSELEKI